MSERCPTCGSGLRRYGWTKCRNPWHDRAVQSPATPQEPSGAQLALADIERAYSETEVALAQVVSRNDKELFFNGDKALRAHLQKNLDYYRIRRDGVRALLTPQEPSEPQVDVVRLLRQCQDISHILGEVGCQAMPLVDGVRWLVDKQTALRAENTRLREALTQARRDFGMIACDGSLAGVAVARLDAALTPDGSTR